MSEPVSLLDYEVAARERMSHMAYEYVSGGAGDECTLEWNQTAWNDVRLRSRVLIDVSALDTSTVLLGRGMPQPILLAPTAYQKLIVPEGEVATARGASDVGAPMIVSSFSTSSIEEIASATTAPLWFQLYLPPDRAFAESLVRRVEAAGCEALCLTVDTPVLGARYREARTAFSLPESLTRVILEGMQRVAANAAHRPQEGAIYSAVLDSRLTWKDVEWLRTIARIPVLLKGIMDPEDARIAVESGVDGLIVSNHGARNLDTVPATVQVLPRVRDAVRGRIPILVDGGVRRGTDVLKAIALGASAVLIGRPYLYGLAVEGSAGVSRVVRILRTELEMAMALTGRASINAIDENALWV